MCEHGYLVMEKYGFIANLVFFTTQRESAGLR
jgi:hypothetical protein